MEGYVKTPPLAWSGWRLRIPGGPEGGQYHGYLAGDSAGPWDPQAGGIALREGETRSDYVYRSSAELPPRANASGGANVIREFQTRRTAGFAEAPGSYGLGMPMPVIRAFPPIIYHPPILPPRPPIVTQGTHPPIYHPPVNTVRQPPPPARPKPAPTISTTAAAAATAAALKAAAAKAAAAQAAAVKAASARAAALSAASLKAAQAKAAAAQAAALKAAQAKASAAEQAALKAAAAKAAQTLAAAIAKAKSDQVAADIAARKAEDAAASAAAGSGSAGCPTGQFRDAAGNCTSDAHNPYVLYLPNTPEGASPAPAPTVAAPSIDPSTGLPSTVDSSGATPASCSYFDANGNCTSWFGASTLISGVPNMWILAGAGVAAFFLMSQTSGRKR